MLKLFKSISMQFVAAPYPTTKKIIRFSKGYIYRKWLKFKTLNFTSYALRVNIVSIANYFDLKQLSNESYSGEIYDCLIEHYTSHSFDLLGSGWVQVKRNMKCRGVEGNKYKHEINLEVSKKNKKESLRIRGLIDLDYQPIDWQIDFKSGYRWCESTWYGGIKIPYDSPGADIKVPWELSRMQHLPQMALYSINHNNKVNELKREFENQILDFIAHNPPGFGVNWHCTMDVGIRIANILIAYDIFSGQGYKFSNEFEEIVSRSGFEHARHIIQNLEWSETGRSNHYLSNLAGLLSVAAYLPDNLNIQKWGKWALYEFFNEFNEQFDEDGCNVESSTSYHRLSTEISIYSAAFASRILKNNKSLDIPKYSPHYITSRTVDKFLANKKDENLPVNFIEKLYKAIQFPKSYTRPDGLITQIGDNDSGRFLKISALHQFEDKDLMIEKYKNLKGYENNISQKKYLFEKSLNHNHLIEASYTFYKANELDFSTNYKNQNTESVVLEKIAGLNNKTELNSSEKETKFINEYDSIQFYIDRFDQASSNLKQIYYFDLNEIDSFKQLKITSFKSFGLYIMRAPGFYATFRCGPERQYGQGSHLHHDQLSLEIIIGKKNISIDPGTYLYTPLLPRRNKYRSILSHFCPTPINLEIFDEDIDPFVFHSLYKAKCIYMSDEGIVGVHEGFGEKTFRIIMVENSKLVIRDFSDGVELRRCNFNSDTNEFIGSSYSYGYGYIEN